MRQRTEMMIRAILPSIGIAMFAVSCVSTAGTRVKSYPSDTLIRNSRLLADKLEVTDCRKTRVSNLMKVQVTARNRSREDLLFEYRFRWLDANGFEIRTQLSNWNTIECVAKDTMNMTGVAPNAKAEDFELLVRFPQRW